MSYNDPTKASKPRGFDPLETTDEWLDMITAPSKPSKLRDYIPIIDNTDDERAKEYMAKYRPVIAPQPFGSKANRREAVLIEGDVRHDVVRYQGQVLPKPSRCSMYSAYGEEGRDGEEFERVDETPPPSPIGEGFEGEADNGYAEECGEVRESCMPAPLQPRRRA